MKTIVKVVDQVRVGRASETVGSLHSAENSNVLAKAVVHSCEILCD